MPSLRRVVEAWIALYLTVGQLTWFAVRTASFVPSGVELTAGFAAALVAAVGLLRLNPELDVGRLWRVGLTAYGVLVLVAVIGVLAGRPIGELLAAYERYTFPLAVGIALLLEPVHESGLLTRT